MKNRDVASQAIAHTPQLALEILEDRVLLAAFDLFVNDGLHWVPLESQQQYDFGSRDLYDSLVFQVRNPISNYSDVNYDVDTETGPYSIYTGSDTVLAPGESGTFTVSFNAVGSAAGWIYVSDWYSESGTAIYVTGTVTDPYTPPAEQPEIAVSWWSAADQQSYELQSQVGIPEGGPVDFGSTRLGSYPIAQSFTIQNVGSLGGYSYPGVDPLAVFTPQIWYNGIPAVNSPLTVQLDTYWTGYIAEMGEPYVLYPGDSQWATFSVTLQTDATADLSGYQIVIPNSDSDEMLFTIPLAGQVIGGSELTVYANQTDYLTDGIGIDNDRNGIADRPLTFGTWQVGQTPSSITFNLYNDGLDPLWIYDPTVFYNGQPVNNNSPLSILLDASWNTSEGAYVCIDNDDVNTSTFTVSLNTQYPVDLTGYSIAFEHTDSDESPFDIPLFGQVIAPPPVVEKNPPEISVFFGESPLIDGQTAPIYVGSTELNIPGLAHTFTVRNDGEETLLLSAPQLPAGFILTESLATSLDAGQSDTFTIQLLTSSPGSFTGTLLIPNNDSDENPFDFVISGDVTAPEILVTLNSQVIADNAASAIDFGTVMLGTANLPELTFKVENTGTSVLTLGTLQLPQGYAIKEGLVSSLAPGQFDTFTVAMQTDALGDWHGAIQFTNNDADENPFNFPIKGTVAAPDITIFFDDTELTAGQAAALDMGLAVLDSTPAAQTFKVRNDGNYTLTLSALSLPDGFILIEALDETLLPGQADTFTLAMQTAQPGLWGGHVQILSNDPDEPAFDFPITGIVTACEIVVTTDDSLVIDDSGIIYNFGKVNQSGSPATMTFTVRNAGDADLSLGELQIPAGYSLLDPLVPILAPNQTDAFTIQLDTDQPGIKTGEIVFDNGDRDETPFNIAIAGEVLAPVELTSNNRTRFIGENGEKIIVKLIGPGTMQLFASTENINWLESIILTDTTAASSLKVIVRGGDSTAARSARLRTDVLPIESYPALVGNVTINGSLGLLSVKSAIVTGQVTASGSIDALFFDDIAGSAAVSTALWSPYGSTLMAKAIGSGASFDIAGRVDMFRAKSFEHGALKAGCFDRILVEQGNLAVNILADKGVINQVQAQGDISGSILAICDINSVVTAQGTLSATVRARRIGSILAQNLDNAILSASERINAVIIREDIRDSHILAGYDIGLDGVAGAGDALTGGDLKLLSFGGELKNSHVAIGVAPIYSTLIPVPSGGSSSGVSSKAKIRGNAVAADNNGQQFGIYYDAQAGSSIDSNLPASGDFMIVDAL